MTLGIVFPGQGSQRIGMLGAIQEEYSQVAQTFHEASDVLGYDLWDLVVNGPSEKLDATMHTQPALLTASVAIWRILTDEAAIKPALLAGHSLGEYSALVCAESLTFADAVRLVALRGQYMQAAVKPGEGAMAAIIGLEPEDVIDICQQANPNQRGVLSPANYNSIGQIVIAGNKQLVEQAVVFAKEKGAKRALILPVSVPSHCALMKPAADNLASELRSITINAPRIPVINNAAVTPYASANDIQQGLILQLYSPVRWIETLQYFVQHGATTVIECGPEKVLTGLNKRIEKSLHLMATSDLDDLHTVMQFLAEKQSI